MTKDKKFILWPHLIAGMWVVALSLAQGYVYGVYRKASYALGTFSKLSGIDFLDLPDSLFQIEDGGEVMLLYLVLMSASTVLILYAKKLLSGISAVAYCSFHIFLVIISAIS